MYSKFLMVEDGSIDVDDLQKDLKENNPDIKVIVYRNGSKAPYLVNNVSNIASDIKEAISGLINAASPLLEVLQAAAGLDD